jgi:hypothetical protein
LGDDDWIYLAQDKGKVVECCKKCKTISGCIKTYDVFE